MTSEFATIILFNKLVSLLLWALRNSHHDSTFITHIYRWKIIKRTSSTIRQMKYKLPNFRLHKKKLVSLDSQKWYLFYNYIFYDNCPAFIFFLRISFLAWFCFKKINSIRAKLRVHQPVWNEVSIEFWKDIFKNLIRNKILT